MDGLTLDGLIERLVALRAGYGSGAIPVVFTGAGEPVDEFGVRAEAVRVETPESCGCDYPVLVLDLTA